jgi:hypothetical protein
MIRFLALSFALVLQAAANPPNFVIVYVDDLGWTDTAVEMIKGRPDTKSDYYQTPGLLRLARDGMVFSAGYAPAPVCTPSRNSMLHGMTPARMHNSVLEPKESVENYQGKITIPQALKQANPDYVTAHFGKWHNPTLTPKKAGFDVSDGPTGNGEGDYLDDMKTFLPKDDPKRIVSLTHKSQDFIKKQAKAGKPFFLQLSHYSVHIWQRQEEPGPRLPARRPDHRVALQARLVAQLRRHDRRYRRLLRQAP